VSLVGTGQALTNDVAPTRITESAGEPTMVVAEQTEAVLVVVATRDWHPHF